MEKQKGRGEASTQRKLERRGDLGGAPSKSATAYLAPAMEVKEQKPKRAGAVKKRERAFEGRRR